MDVRTAVIGGKKFKIALDAISHGIEKGGTLKVGFLDGATYPAEDGRPSLSVAQVAFWNEFGTKRAPPRPFFRTTISEQSKTWGDKLGKAVVFYKYDGALALSAVGLSMKDDITASIARWTTPPNAASTIARKGFNKPLIHTGVMQRSVDYAVTP